MRITELLIVVYRFFKAKKELNRTKGLNTRLNSKHTKNAVLLPNRVELLKSLKENLIVLEVGVAEGDFSKKILQLIKPKELHLIDIWRENRYGSGYSPGNLWSRGFRRFDPWKNINIKFESEIQARKIILHRGYSAEKMKGLPSDYYDFIYIDAAHDYENVKTDLLEAHRLIKRDGIISGHDYIKWGRFGYKTGVVEAVNEFVNEFNYEFLFFTMDDKTTASFAIRKIHL
jgi:hypothetical protein